MSKTFVIDLGGTNTKLALFNNEELSWETNFKTPSLPENFIKKISDNFLNLNLADSDALKLVVGVPGFWNKEKILKQSINLPNYLDQPIWDEISSVLNPKEFKFYTDVELACLGEVFYGAAKDYPDLESLLYINLGTGLSGAFFKDGKLLQSSKSPCLRLDYLSINSHNEIQDKNIEALRGLILDLSLILSPELIVLGGGKFKDNWQSFVEPAIKLIAENPDNPLSYQLKFSKSRLKTPAFWGALVDI